MKKFATLGAAVIAVAFSVSGALAANPKKSASVNATIVGVSDISTFEVKGMDKVTVPGGGVEFTNPDNALAWSAKGSRYIKLAVTNNQSWVLKTYTDNFNYDGGILPDTTTWTYQYGGLKGPVSNGKGQMAGLAWLVLPNEDVTAFNGPDAKDPSEVIPGTTDPASDWLFVKDRSDQNIPVPAGDTDSSDESFSGSGGYTNVAFSEGVGAAAKTRIVRPTKGAADSFSEPLPNKADPFYYFLGASFNGLVPGAYTATVNFELINL